MLSYSNFTKHEPPEEGIAGGSKNFKDWRTKAVACRFKNYMDSEERRTSKRPLHALIHCDCPICVKHTL